MEQDLSQVPVPYPVLGFSAKANGNATPTILNPSVGASFDASAFTTDSTGQFYMVGLLPNQSSAVINVFSAGSTGQPMPIRQFTPAPNTEFVLAMAADTTGQLYIAGINPYSAQYPYYYDSFNVSIFSPTTNTTNQNALYTIVLPYAESPAAIGIDGAGNIYVACNSVSPNPTGIATGNPQPQSTGSIYVYAAGASNAGKPARTITSTSIFSGMAVDAAGDIFAIEPTASLVEFAAGANGVATPVKVLSGSATGLTAPVAVQVDAAGNLYILNSPPATISGMKTYTPSILVFGPAAAGNEPPAATITSTAWTEPGVLLTVN